MMKVRGLGALRWLIKMILTFRMYFSGIHFDYFGTALNIHTILHESSHFSGMQRTGKYLKIYGDEGSRDFFYTLFNQNNYNDMQNYIRNGISNTERDLKKLDANAINEKFGVKLNRVNIALHNADTLGLVALNLGHSKMKRLSGFDENEKVGKFRKNANKNMHKKYL
ncbi:hypothetical protein MML63_10270 [Kosakonia sacchari]|uniref:hypothetical protein n=1 Tax=Kosakonia sacchari TaxID=1158459 RepID=UPI0025B19720|nr:hypothetical protein [Kosakonia sacchari]MDN2486011.1 hypothetical protein [Kosakonia sacchari]